MTERTHTIGAPSDSVADRAMRALGTVIDPELGLDVVMLGLVYDVRHEGSRVEVDMTLTTPGCPVSEQLPREAEEAIRRALPEHDVVLQIVWEPAWSPDRLTPEAMDVLGFRRR
ncbi:MAG: metal-sulfur cluster assembly factor [Acidimicrobiia bacterium]|nr:metal-sulfur cluster assembly factor [Acidimicrobiia bacterium]